MLFEKAAEVSNKEAVKVLNEQTRKESVQLLWTNASQGTKSMLYIWTKVPVMQ